MSGTLPRTGEGAIDHDQAIASRSNDLAAQPPFGLSELDVRRKHDSVVTFILGRGVVRRATRVVSLLALDFIGVMGAIYTALLLKIAAARQYQPREQPGTGPTRRSRSPT